VDKRRGAFDFETLQLLRSVLEEAWQCLRPDEQARATKSLLAERILKLAASGERDPIRLRIGELTTVVTSSL
jgi:hypothetical protein